MPFHEDSTIGPINVILRPSPFPASGFFCMTGRFVRDVTALVAASISLFSTGDLEARNKGVEKHPANGDTPATAVSTADNPRDGSAAAEPTQPPHPDVRFVNETFEGLFIPVFSPIEAPLGTLPPGWADRSSPGAVVGYEPWDHLSYHRSDCRACAGESAGDVDA